MTDFENQKVQKHDKVCPENVAVSNEKPTVDSDEKFLGDHP